MKMELLAPAGNVENFVAAIEAGADAVYVGAPGINARALTKEISFEEISAMIEYCRKREKKFYLAANSLILEHELAHVIKSLAVYESLRPDGLIVQDMGLVRLVKNYFPSLPLHGSTLMAAHNVSSVNVQEQMGCERAVLARELTLDEIRFICENSSIELEVFIHGAMCYSYSGLCLFSSYLGGKSGLRGRCVQPCRRAYTKVAGKPGGGGRRKGGSGRHDTKGRGGQFFFSMNDLSGVESIRGLMAAGVSSLKIEGRLKSANYVTNVVKAYRKLIDLESSADPDSVREAEDFLKLAMSRKTSTGYFFDIDPEKAISRLHSGNIGIHLGKVSRSVEHKKESFLFLCSKEKVVPGDRLRLHDRKTGENYSFRLLADPQVKKEGSTDSFSYSIEIPEKIKDRFSGDGDLYKVDGGAAGIKIDESLKYAGRQRKKAVEAIAGRKKRYCDKVMEKVFAASDKQAGYPDISAKKRKSNRSRQRGRVRKDKMRITLPLWLKTDSIGHLESRLPFLPERVILPLRRDLVKKAGIIRRILGKRARSAIWSLPPVIHDSDTRQFLSLTGSVQKNGFRSFQIGHMSQKLLFVGQKVTLHGNYSFNVMNSQSFLQSGELMGLESLLVSPELDRLHLQQLFECLGKNEKVAAGRSGNKVVVPGIVVYGRLPLFTSRLDISHQTRNGQIVSPKGEQFTVEKRSNLCETYAVKPFSLFPHLAEIERLGVRFGVVDFSGLRMGKKEMTLFGERLNVSKKQAGLSSFNYSGSLL